MIAKWGLLLVPLLWAGAASAESWRGGERGASEGLDRVVEQMRSEGRVLAAEEQQQHGRTIYRIRLLTPEGRVRHYQVDAASGERLPRDRE